MACRPVWASASRAVAVVAGAAAAPPPPRARRWICQFDSPAKCGKTMQMMVNCPKTK
jgi:hypothetical protein